MEDRHHIIWIGSYKGVFSINSVSGEMTHYTHYISLLPGNIVYCITEDKKKKSLGWNNRRIVLSG
jgi:hypothetical protein